MAQHVRTVEARGFDEPQVEAREVVDALHPLRVPRAAEARMRRRPHRVTRRQLLYRAREATVASGAVQDQQRRPLASDPGVYVDATDADGVLTDSHGPYYAPNAMGERL